MEKVDITCLVHHRSEGCADGRLATLDHSDVMIRPILGRPQDLKKLSRKHSFNSDVLERQVGWVKGASKR